MARRLSASGSVGAASQPGAAAVHPTWGPAAVAALPVVLGVVLLGFWLGPSGVRGIHWVPPAPLLPDLSSPATASLQAAGGIPDASQFVAILERPIFSPGRRPPPPVVVPVVVPPPPPPPPDPFEKVRILGVFTGAPGGVIAEIDGKPRRLMRGEAIGAWNLSTVSGSDATFTDGKQSRVLSLVKPKKPNAPGPATYVQGGVVKAPPVVVAPAGAVNSGAAAAASAAGQAPAAAPPGSTAPAAPPPAMPPRAPGLPIPMPDGSLRMP